VRTVTSAGKIAITLRPTRAGLSQLKADGRLRVRARFTYRPCGASADTERRRYTLKLR
jgi:hypothetical protein